MSGSDPSPVAPYASVLVSDNEGTVTVQLQVGDDLEPGCLLEVVGQQLIAELRSGEVDVDYDEDARGEALMVIEQDPEGFLEMDVVMNPPADPSDGQLSGAQALAFSALFRLQESRGASMLWEQIDGPDGNPLN